MHGGNASGDRTHDVGFEAVTHGQRVRRSDQRAGAPIDSGLGLASGCGTLAGRVRDGAHQRTVAERLAALDRQRRIEVRRVEGCAPLDGESALRQRRPVDLLVEALNHGGRRLIGAVHQREALFFDGEAQAGAAEDKHLGSLVEFFGHDGGDVHGRGHDHVGVRIEIHPVKLLSHLGRRTHRVIGNER